MVGLVLANSVMNSGLQLDATVAQLLPGVTGHAGQITLKQLALHRSGLPRLPDNMSLDNMQNPYADYHREDMIEALNQVTLNAPEFAYSNFGYGVLGVALSSWHNTALPELLQQQIFSPANMQSSALAMDGLSIDKMVDGHDIGLRRVEHWTFDAMAGAGAVVSTLSDMLKFAQYILENQTAESVALFLQTHTETTPHMGLGVFRQGQIISHAGQTGGFAAHFMLDLSSQTAVVVLTNVSRDASILGTQIMQQITE